MFVLPSFLQKSAVALAVAGSCFIAGAAWQNGKVKDAQNAAIEKRMNEYFAESQKGAVTSASISNALSDGISAKLTSNQKQKQAALERIKNSPAKKLTNDSFNNDSAESTGAAGSLVPGVYGPPDYLFDGGTVWLFDAARQALPADQPASRSYEEAAAIANIGIPEFVANDFEVVRLYNELSDRHNALIDYIELLQSK